MNPLAGEGNPEGATQTLAQDMDRPFFHAGLLRHPAKPGLHVVQGALYVCLSGGPAEAPVIDGEDVVALLRQPGDVEDVTADVLGIAVEEIDGTPGLAFIHLRRQPPAMQRLAVGRIQVDVLVIEIEPVRRDIGDVVGVEKNAATAALQDRQRDDHSR